VSTIEYWNCSAHVTTILAFSIDFYKYILPKMIGAFLRRITIRRPKANFD